MRIGNSNNNSRKKVRIKTEKKYRITLPDRFCDSSGIELDSVIQEYQEGYRCYLDEYPEQKENRALWFQKNQWFLHKSRFGLTSLLFDGAGDYLQLPDSDDWYFEERDFAEHWTSEIFEGTIEVNEKFKKEIWSENFTPPTEPLKEKE